jgi:dienelactone hydrolase
MGEMTGYDQFSFAVADSKKTVYVKGQGPGILLMHELPGMIEQCVRLADHLAGQGFTMFLPLLFGEANVKNSLARTALYTAQICISREIRAFAAETDSPIADWLRALAREIRTRRPEGRGIGVIGMCLTGGFVINLMLEDVVRAPVACQPSLPLTTFGAPRDALSASPATLAQAVRKAAETSLLCYRFDQDRICPRERFDRLAREFGPSFEGHLLPGKGHATLTVGFVDDPHHPTFAARERIVNFFRERLVVEG